jgi:hypothetical protein
MGFRFSSDDMVALVFGIVDERAGFSGKITLELLCIQK